MDEDEKGRQWALLCDEFEEVQRKIFRIVHPGRPSDDIVLTDKDADYINKTHEEWIDIKNKMDKFVQRHVVKKV